MGKNPVPWNYKPPEIYIQSKLSCPPPIHVSGQDRTDENLGQHMNMDHHKNIGQAL